MNTETAIRPGDLVTYNGRGTWLVKAVNGNTLTVTNPHTHGGRTYLPADKCTRVEAGA